MESFSQRGFCRLPESPSLRYIVVMVTLDSLPTEIVLHVAQFLEPLDIVTLQHVCKRLLTLGRDHGLWREQCFLESSFLENLRRRRELIGAEPEQEPRFRDLARALAHGNGIGVSRVAKTQGRSLDLKALSAEKIRIRANWDPSYPGEEVNWYGDYIARNAPISTSWLQQPRNRESIEHEYLEIRGVALYKPPGELDSTLAVAPLDDGSLCLWDIVGTKGRKGGIFQRSKSGILTVDSHHQCTIGERSKMVSTGVTECISVDSGQKRAYIAVQSALVEVDLETLEKVSHERFPSSITALSEVKYPTPVTVGTNLSLYLHDSRSRARGVGSGEVELFDSYDAQPQPLRIHGSLDFRRLLNPVTTSDFTPSAHLYQPGPSSILHTSDGDWNGSGDIHQIYVCGRFPSILNYDRRNFPKLKCTIHSGARLCSMTSLPFPFEAKTRPGKTLIACGEYNSKGSLEMYGLSFNPESATASSEFCAGSVQISSMKNRQTSSSSKLLSVSNHGTRVVVSDGGGYLKWLERDGFTEARRWNIAHGSVEAPRGIFGTLGDSYMNSGSGDIVIKILENQGDLILWTGEKLGILNFSSKPGFNAESFENTHKTCEESNREREELVYSETMRLALEHQANEVRYVAGLGLGRSGSF